MVVCGLTFKKLYRNGGFMINRKLFYSYLDEYFDNHNELESYQLVSIIMRLIGGTFDVSD